MRLNATGSLGSFAAVTVQMGRESMDLGQGKIHQMYSVILEREVPPGKMEEIASLV